MPECKPIAQPVNHFKRDHEDNEYNQTDEAKRRPGAILQYIAKVVTDARQAGDVAHEKHEIAEPAMDFRDLLDAFLLRPRFVPIVESHDHSRKGARNSDKYGQEKSHRAESIVQVVCERPILELRSEHNRDYANEVAESRM